MSDEKNPMIRTVRVTTIKEIRVELTPAVFGGMSEKQYLEEFRQGLWDVEGMDDIFSTPQEWPQSAEAISTMLLDW